MDANQRSNKPSHGIITTIRISKEDDEKLTAIAEESFGTSKNKRSSTITMLFKTNPKFSGFKDE